MTLGLSFVTVSQERLRWPICGHRIGTNAIEQIDPPNFHLRPHVLEKRLSHEIRSHFNSSQPFTKLCLSR